MLLGQPMTAEEAEAGFGPLAVDFVVVAGAPPSDRFASELERESIRLVPAPAGDLEADVARVLLVWLPAGVTALELARLTAGRERRAVIGCAPTGSTEDSERALAAGFDDFVAGRAAAREMARRLRAVERRVRRGAPPGSPRERYGRVRIDLDQHRLWVDGQRVALTRTELAVMAALVDAAGQVRSRADLLLRAWGSEGLEVGERAVDNIIMRLRRKLPIPDLLVTVRGVGFRLDP